MTHNNPNVWDETIWDPFNPEIAIEDPLHGPSAVHSMLQIPAMPQGDGTYYQPGAYYTTGTAYLDSQDRPLFKLGKAIGLGDIRGVSELQEWVSIYQTEGREGLVALEATRQQKRLEETGAAHCFKPTDVCPGGKQLSDCEIGATAYSTAQEWIGKSDQEKPNQGTLTTSLAWAGGKCVECAVSCEVAVTTHDGKPQATRVSFSKPHPDAIVIELPSLTRAPLSAAELEKLQLGPIIDPDTTN